MKTDIKDTFRSSRKGYLRRVFVILMMLVAGVAVQAQTWYMENGDTVRIIGCQANAGTLYDDGGADGDYNNNFSGYAVIEAVPGATISLSGTYNQEECCDRLSIWDGNMMTGTKIVDEIAGTGTFNVTATSGVVTIWFHSDGSVTSSGFEITWNVQGISTTCSGSASGLTVDAVSATGATLSWTGDAGSYNVYVDNRMVATTSSTSHTLTDLNPGMAHEVTVTPTGIGATICCSDTALIRSDFCNGTELPLREKFDDITLGAIPACWIRSMNFDDEESKPQVVEAGRQGRAMLLSCGNNATPSHFGMVVGPHIGDAEATWHVGFRLKASHDWTRLVVGFCDNTSSEYNSYGFVPMDTLELMQPGTWTEHHYTWTRPAGKSRLAFRMIRDMQDGDMRTVYIDDVRIEKCGIYNLRNYRTDAFGTYVEWTTSGTPVVSIGIRRADRTNDSVVTTGTSPMHITGLEAGTRYILSFYTQCGSEEGLVDQLSFTTAPAAIALDHLCIDKRTGAPFDQINIEDANGNEERYSMRSGPNGPAYLVSPQLIGHEGKEIVLKANGYYSNVSIGTMTYRDDTSTFTPLASGFTSYYGMIYLKATIPASTTDNYVAVRFNSEFSVHNLEIGMCLIDSLRVTHRRGTSVTLAWQSNGPNDTVLVEYGEENFVQGTGTVATFVGQRRGRINGLAQDRRYDFIVYRPCSTPVCGNSRMITYTVDQDYPLPFCEDFENAPWHGNAWNPVEGFLNYPSIRDEYFLNQSNKALELGAAGVDWGYRGVIELPDVEIDSNSVLSFYATHFAPGGKLLLGWRTDTWENRIIDTIDLGGTNIRTHYNIPLPATDEVLDHRLALIYYHRIEYSNLRCYIDELQITHGSYDYHGTTFVERDSVVLRFTYAGPSANATVTMVSDATGHSYTQTLGTSDTIAAGFRLPAGSYHCYFAPQQDGCTSLVDWLQIADTGGGCFYYDMHDLLSYELPGGWMAAGSTQVEDSVLVFDSLLVSSPAPTLQGLYLQFVASGTRLLVGYTTDNNLSSTTVATIIDTVELAAEQQMHHVLMNAPDGARICFVAEGGACSLRQVYLSSCLPPAYQIVGGNLVFSMPEEIPDAEYDLTFYSTLNNGRYAYHVDAAHPVVHALPRGEVFNMEYSCNNAVYTCHPPIRVYIPDSIYLPYCEPFYHENGQSGLPNGWSIFYTDTNCQPHLFFDWGELPLVVGCEANEWGRSQYTVMPPVATHGHLIIRATVYCNWDSERWIEIGTMADGTDTASFIPLVRSTRWDDWETLYAETDSLGDRRIAFRTYHGNVFLNNVSLGNFPSVAVRLVDSHTLRLDADQSGQYYIHYNNYNGGDSVLTIDTTPYFIRTEEWINDVQVDMVMDSLGTICDNRYRTYQLSERFGLPFCKSDGWWDWWLRRHGTGPIDYFTAEGNHVIGFHTHQMYPTDEYLLLPDFDIDSMRHASISFRLRSAYYTDTLVVGIMTDAYDTTTFVPVDTVVYDDDERQWHTFRTSLEAYRGDGRWIAFHHRNGSHPAGNDETFLQLDDVKVTSCPAAIATATLNSYNTVQIIAPGDSLEAPYLVEYGPRGFSQGSGTLIRITANPTLLTLAPNSDYDFYFRCDSNTMSCDNAQQIHTLNAPIVPPVCFNFDDLPVDGIPEDWTSQSAATAVSNSTAHSGANALCVANRIVTTAIDIDSLQQMSLGLWVYAEHPSDRLLVGTMTDPADAASFTRMLTIVPSQTGVWEHRIVSFRSAPRNAHFIALRHANATTPTLQPTLFVDDLSFNTCAAFDMRVVKAESDSVILTWEMVGTPNVTISVTRDDNTPVGTYTPSQPPLVIAPLSPHHGYQIVFNSSCTSGTTPCDIAILDTATIVTPKPGTGCVNTTDLSSADALFTSGTFGNPYDHAGAVNYGSLSVDSRHTVCYDTTQHDPRTGGLLRTIPSGSTSSVRLGNWSSNPYRPEAEAITYSLFVDTLSFNLLIMRYAAVLQNPMHAPEDQPRFRLELLDSSFTPINPECTSADFIADQSLGWNEAANNVLWKDWTTFGIDLSAYADQQVYVRLTTFDCNEGSHFGYAYFTLECMRRNVVTENCGDVSSNTLTAPMGFNYRWYDSTNATLGTSQALTIPSANTTYYCDVSSQENPACSFTISAFAGSRYPMARFDTVVTYKDCGFLVRFINNSTVSSDGITPLGTDEPCESARWDFGNGATSSSYHGQTFYNQPGTYTVTLVSGIADGSCTDTATLTLTLAYPPYTPQISGPESLCYGAVDTLYLLDAHTANTTWHTHDSTQFLPCSPSNYVLGKNVYTIEATDPNGCDVSLQHILFVNPVYSQSDTMLLCSPQLPYSYADTVFQPGTTSAEFHRHFTSSDGCDSSFHLWLSVSNSSAALHFDTLDAVICDNQQYSFFGNTYNTPGQHSEVHLDDAGICDSIHILNLTVNATSTGDTSASACDRFVWYGSTFTADTNTVHVTSNALGCDSTITLHLALRHSSDTIITHYIVENALPYRWNGISFADDTTGFVHTLLNHQDCDSTVTFNLVVYRNHTATLADSLCEGLLPYTWNGVLFSPDEADPVTSVITHQTVIPTVHGADSLITMHLTVLRNSTRTIHDTLVQNALAAYSSPLTPAPTMPDAVDASAPALLCLADTVWHTVNAAGCDSTVVYTLHVYRNYADTLHVNRCDNQVPYTWHSHTLAADTTLSDTLASVHGADSVTTLVLAVHPTYDLADTIVVCPGSGFIYEGVDYGGPTEFDSPHLTIHDCDSMVHVVLRPRDGSVRLAPVVSLDGSPWMTYDTTLLDCRPSELRLLDTAASVSRQWTFWPADGQGDTLSGTDSLLTASFDTTGIFSFQLIAVDSNLCNDTIRRDSALWVFPTPEASFIWSPDHVSIHNPEVHFYNQSTPEGLSFRWLISQDQSGSSFDTLLDESPAYRWEVPVEAGDYPASLVAYWLHHGPDTLTITCTDTSTVPIAIVNTYLQFPNSVTPNGDGMNDRWVIVNLLEMGEYSMNELWIYDRFGALVYHVENIHRLSDFWDPNQTNSPDGTYYYRFSAKNNFGLVKRNGVIEVSR